MKQGRECSLLLEYRNGKVTTTLKVSKLRRSEARTPISDTKSQAEKINKGYGGKKKKNLSKLLDYHQKLVDEKGLPPSKLMLKHAAKAPSASPPKDGCTFQCDQCENKFNSKRKLKQHMRNKHTNLQKPEELRDVELVLEQEESSQDFKCEHCEKTFTSKQGVTIHIGHKHKDLKKTEVQRSEVSDNSLNMSEVNEERENISLPLANSTINAEEEGIKKDVSCEGCGLTTPFFCSMKSSKYWKSFECPLCGGCKEHSSNGKCFYCHCGTRCESCKSCLFEV